MATCWRKEKDPAISPCSVGCLQSRAFHCFLFKISTWNHWGSHLTAQGAVSSVYWCYPLILYISTLGWASSVNADSPSAWEGLESDELVPVQPQQDGKMKWFQGSGEVTLDRASLAQLLCYLGAVLDSWLLLKDQVAAIDRGAFVQLQFMHQLCSFLDLEILLRIHSCLVTSQLDYYNTLYMDRPWRPSWKSQLNAEAHAVSGTPQFACSCPLQYFFPWIQFINFFWLS